MWLARIIKNLAAITLVVGVALLVYCGWVILFQPAAKPAFNWQGLVAAQGYNGEPITRMREEIHYRCGDVYVVFQGRPRREMMGVTLQQLQERYPAAAGWQVEVDNDGSLVLRQKRQEFCPLHAGYRHLGLYGSNVAVYAGPLGGEGPLLRVEEKLTVSNLPSEWRNALLLASNFKQLTPEEQGRLKQMIEFKNETELYAVLENLDEMVED